MIANFGYKDGSGEFYIAIDTDKCNGCGDCIPACPSHILALRDNEFDPMADDQMVVILDEFRKKIKYACAACKPDHAVHSLPCVNACAPVAITHSW
ncbi:MAG: 4Fe-4S dicluster domain-containing protein [Candidatus Kapabacteria bacterium]|nr:4Fe-4S dicluster domain-containing protein [Candidatus Kapabacteria bacterium]